MHLVENERLYIVEKRYKDGTLSPVYMSLKEILKTERNSELILDFFLSKSKFLK